MAPQIQINERGIPTQPSRLVFTLAPFTLVRIGPNLDAALNGLISSLIAALSSKQNNILHFATTYSLANVAIVIDCFESGEEIRLQLLRLRLRPCLGTVELTPYPFENALLSQRIADQLQIIQKRQPTLVIPFRCVEDWYGLGPRDHPIYDRMVEASTSKDVWREFKAGLRDNCSKPQRRKQPSEYNEARTGTGS
ncbi:hypothetical protein K469DRAFT_687395 [Zopfia rhizophila CBS 207.26]|uniref:Uncharacterized protein n=1 Tax=Zopfia rhizophila CBS 207.26 TaxID=1314779 RepID=A0A6A6D9C4_9PEZI|nr:hypothetical protein K469DRAFT_687395 [Zopfia rhizophila CBS 207.26]